MLAERTISIIEAARRCGTHPNTIRRWLSEGRLEGERTPYGRVVNLESVEQLRADRDARQKETLSR